MSFDNLSEGYEEFRDHPQDEDLITEEFPYDNDTQIHHPVVLTSSADHDPSTQMSTVSFQFGNLHIGRSHVRHFLEKLHLVSPRVTLPKHVLTEYRKIKPVLESFKRESSLTIIELSEWLARFGKQGSTSMFDHTFKMMNALGTSYSHEVQSFMSSGIALFDVLDSVSKLREKEWRRLVKTQLKLARARKRQSDPLTLRQFESSYFQYNDQYELSQRTYIAKSRDSYIEIVRNLCQQSLKFGEMLREDLLVINNVAQLSLQAPNSPIYAPQHDAMAGPSASQDTRHHHESGLLNQRRAGAASELIQRRSDFYPRYMSRSNVSTTSMSNGYDADAMTSATDQGDRLAERESPRNPNDKIFVPVSPLRGAQAGLKARDKNTLAVESDSRGNIKFHGTHNENNVVSEMHAKPNRNGGGEENTETESVQNENDNPWN